MKDRSYNNQSTYRGKISNIKQYTDKGYQLSPGGAPLTRGYQKCEDYNKF